MSTRIWLTAMLAAGLALGSAGCGGRARAPDLVEEPVAVDYAVLDEQEEARGTSRVVFVKVLVPIGIDEAGVRSVGQRATQDVVRRRAVSGVRVYLVDTALWLGVQYNIAQVTWGPEGSLDAAWRSPPGEYRAHRFHYRVKKKVTDPRRLPRPSEQEILIFGVYMRAVLQAGPLGPGGMSHGQVLEAVARRFDMTPEALKELVDRAWIWINY